MNDVTKPEETKPATRGSVEWWMQIREDPPLSELNEAFCEIDERDDERLCTLAMDTICVVGEQLGELDSDDKLEATLADLCKLLRHTAKEAFIENLGLAPEEEAAVRRAWTARYQV